ncbi:DUF732 domain-containing protein [Nocardia sp. NPDC003979]
MRHSRVISALLAAGTATAVTALAPQVEAKPATGSSSGSSETCAARSNADRMFLRRADFDDEPCRTQDAAIRLALSNCQWLATHGHSASKHIELAEINRASVRYPYTFLDAAVTSYCPQYDI